MSRDLMASNREFLSNQLRNFGNSDELLFEAEDKVFKLNKVVVTAEVNENGYVKNITTVKLEEVNNDST